MYIDFAKTRAADATYSESDCLQCFVQQMPSLVASSSTLRCICHLRSFASHAPSGASSQKISERSSALSAPASSLGATPCVSPSYNHVRLPANRRTPLPRLRNVRHARSYASHASVPQSYIEKVVERFAVDLPPGKKVRAGDFVTLSPAHVVSWFAPPQTHFKRATDDA
jgi:hypothetical protein